MSFFALAVFSPETVTAISAHERTVDVTTPAALTFSVDLFTDRAEAERAASERAAKEPGASVFVLAPVFETRKEK